MVKTEKEVDLLLEKYLNPENGLPAVESLFSELHVLKCDLEKRIQDSIKQQTEITAAMEKLNQRENDFSKLNILLKEKLDKMQNLISGCARDSQQTKESLSKDIVATKNIIQQEVKDRIDDVRKYNADFKEVTNKVSFIQTDLNNIKKTKADIKMLKEIVVAITESFLFGKKKLLDKIKQTGIIQ